jgi:hypothetical protein
MKNLQEIQSIAIQLEELTERLGKALTEDSDSETSISVNFGAFFDKSLNLEDIKSLIAISSCADHETGVTPHLVTTVSAGSLDKLEEKGYLRHVCGEGENGEYELLGRERYLRLGPGARFMWNDDRYSFEERVIYVALCCFSNNYEKTVSLSIPDIATVAKCWEYDAQKALRSLENFGLISVMRQPGQKNVYKVHEPSFDLWH